MVTEDLRSDVRELRTQVEALREALAEAARPYKELAGYLERFQDLARGYFRLLDLYARHGAISPDLVVPGMKDDISRHIVSALFERGDRNISQITEAVKQKRGTASRRIVRERLGELEATGVVRSTAGSKGRTFRVSDDVAMKWSQVLGLSKYGDRTEKSQERRGEHDA